MKIFEESHLRKNYIKLVYKEKISEIIKKIQDNYYLEVDESTDSRGRKILHVLIGTLSVKDRHI
jgi:uncharacterized alkaline shock family protein YloU